jgi:Periplasmic copper-binding protein (NosD)
MVPIALAVLCACAVFPAGAATEVCGILRGVQEWTAAKSPYIVTSDAYLPNTSRLKIGPGVKVRFARKPSACKAEDPAPAPVDWSDSTYVGFRIEGPFHVLGTEENPVVFEPDPPKSGESGKPGEDAAAGVAGAGKGRSALVAWDGLLLAGHNQAGAEIGHAVFRGANRAIHAVKANFFVHHCLFEGNNTGIALGMRGDLSIVNSNFIGNQSAGISLEKARPRVAACLFMGNRGYGIWSDGRIGLFASYNAFWGNAEEHCYRCVHSILKGGEIDTLPDDAGNIIADPVFVGGESHQAAIAADEAADTPNHLVKDKALAKLEAASRPKWAEARPDFKPLGIGPYRLSAYSRLIDAGPPGAGFKDRDGSRGDIGLHGGIMGKLAEDPF